MIAIAVTDVLTVCHRGGSPCRPWALAAAATAAEMGLAARHLRHAAWNTLYDAAYGVVWPLCSPSLRRMSALAGRECVELQRGVFTAIRGLSHGRP